MATFHNVQDLLVDGIEWTLQNSRLDEWYVYTINLDVCAVEFVLIAEWWSHGNPSSLPPVKISFTFLSTLLTLTKLRRIPRHYACWRQQWTDTTFSVDSPIRRDFANICEKHLVSITSCSRWTLACLHINGGCVMVRCFAQPTKCEAVAEELQCVFNGQNIDKWRSQLLNSEGELRVQIYTFFKICCQCSCTTLTDLSQIETDSTNSLCFLPCSAVSR